MPHFEIYVADVEAAKAFYGGLFGWSFSPMIGAENVSYNLIEGHHIGADHTLTGGIMTRADTAHPAGSAIRGGTITFPVDDADASFAWALDNGGAEALPPTDFPGVGRFAHVEDGQGNVVGMITPASGDA